MFGYIPPGPVVWGLALGSACVDICVGSGSDSGTLFFRVKRRELEGGRSSTDGREVPSDVGKKMDA